MFHRNVFPEVDFVLDDLLAQSALIVLRFTVHRVVVNFQSSLSGIRRPTNGAKVTS